MEILQQLKANGQPLFGGPGMPFRGLLGFSGLRTQAPSVMPSTMDGQIASRIFAVVAMSELSR
jgi:hypothetical protein